MLVVNNNRIFQLIEFWSYFSTIISTLHDGYIVRQNNGQCKGGNSVVPIYLVTYLGRDSMPSSIVTRFHKDLTKLYCLTNKADITNLGSPHYSETGCMYTLFSIKSARYKLFNSILPYILSCIIKQYALDIGYIYMWLIIEILRARDLHCISM